MAMPWFIQAKDRVVGPLSEHDLQRLATDGRLRPVHRVAASADGPWLPAGTVPGLAFPAAGDAGGSPRPPAPTVPRPAAATADADAGVQRTVFFWIAVAGGLVVAGLAVDSLVRLTSREKAPPAMAPPGAVATATDAVAAPATTGSAPDASPTAPDAGGADVRPLVALRYPTASIEFPGVGVATCLVSDGHVHDVATWVDHGRWSDKGRYSGDRVYSHDGMYLAQASWANLEQVVLKIFTLPSSEQTHELRFGRSLDRLLGLFCDNQHRVITVTRGIRVTQVRIHGLADGELLREFSPSDDVNYDRAAIDAPGRRLALAAASTLRIYDTEAATAGVRLAVPPGQSRKADPFSQLKALAFSPDGTELAGVIDGGDGSIQLVVWDAAGPVVETHPLPASVRMQGLNKSRHLQYTPDGSGWLVHHRFLYDRRLKATTWIIEDLLSSFGDRAFLDADRVLGKTTTNGSLVSVGIPRERIRAAVEARASGQNALLKPGDAVRIDITVGTVLFADPTETAARLRASVAKGLTRCGLVVEADGPLALSLDYAEAAGRRINEKTGVFGAPTGRTVVETVGRWTCSLRHLPTDRTVWREEAKQGNPVVVRGTEVNEQTARAATFELILGDLEELSFPDFVPADPETPVLPIVTRL